MKNETGPAYLQGVEEDIIKCMKCGNCQAVCPLYRETRSEPAVARGKVQLARAVLKGEVEYTERVARHFDLCLTCLACVANCPCGVRVDKIVLAARAAVAQKRGLPLVQRAAVAGLSSRGLMEAGAKTATLAQKLLFRPVDGGMSPRFPVGLELRRVVPPLAARPLKELLPDNLSLPAPVKKVAFFAGCVTNYVYPGVGLALVEVLQRHGVEVVFPREQHCCGTPVLMMGDRKTAADMARSGIDIFDAAGIDALVTVCGTCGEAFRHHYPDLLRDEAGYGDRAAALARRTCDISEFLTSVVPLDKKHLGPVEAVLTYHEPCHLGRGLGVVRQPVELLKHIPGAEFNPLQQPARCCGGAGLFSLKYYGLSYDILKHKLQDIQSTGAGIVVTGCGSCRIQLSDGLAQANIPARVMHTVEMLAYSMRGRREGVD